MFQVVEYATPFHPQSNGLLERFNLSTLTTQLAILTSEHQRDWDRHTPGFLGLLNSSSRVCAVHVNCARV